MSSAKLLMVLLGLALSSRPGYAQTPAEPVAAEQPHKQLIVKVTLPTVVGLLGEYAGILSSKDKGKVKALTSRNRPRSTSNPVLILSIPLPRSWASSKARPQQ